MTQTAKNQPIPHALGKAGSASNPRGSSESVDAVTAHVTSELRRGRLVPGQRLFESALCEELEVGRGPVREALRILAGRDVIDLIPNRGAWVKKLNRAELRDMIDVLVTVSEGCIQRVIERCSAAERKEGLKPLFQQMVAQAGASDYRALLRSVNAYHSMLARMTSNPQLAKLWDGLNVDHYHSSLAAEVHVENWTLYLGSYEAINKAILAGDAALAHKVLREHANRLKKALEVDGPAVYR